MKLIVTVVAFAICSMTWIQYDAVGQTQTKLVLGGEPAQDIKFHVYQPGVFAKAIYNNISEASNSCPEQLFQSLLSANNQEWENYNTYGGSVKAEQKEESYFAAIKSMDREKNYFELVHKLDFHVNKDHFAIIKFYLTIEDLKKPTSGVIVMREENGRWYRTTTDFTSNLVVMFMRMKSDRLLDLFTNQKKDKILIDTYNKTQKDGKISLLKLVAEFNSWYATKNTEYLNYYIDEKAW